MELTYDDVSEWFDRYYEIVNANMGPLETVPKVGKLFTDDFRFVYYSVPQNADFT